MDASRLEQLLDAVLQTHHGFTAMRRAADEIVATAGATESTALAQQFWADPRPQLRMLSTLLYGEFAAGAPDSLHILRSVVSGDSDWRVQEMLAQAFDRYCATIGYEQAVPMIGGWLADPTANVRRAASEGPRIWTSRPYFKTHPDHAVALLSPLHADPSEYVRKSVGNALRDISRKHPALIQAEVQRWDRSHPATAQTYALASKFLL